MFLPLYDSNPHRRIPWVTLLLIAANAGVMLWLSQMPPQRQTDVVIRRGFVPKRVSQLSDPKLVVQVQVDPAVAKGPFQNAGQKPIGRAVLLQPVASQVYGSFLTMMFLHGNWLHLASNMWFLWIFGNNIEDRLGHLVFPLFYLLGGLLATACHWATDPASTVPVIGASGAVAAVLGAYAITFPTAKVRTLVWIIVIVTLVDLPALLVLGFWFLVQLVQGIGMMQLGINGGVAWWAHTGGFLAGLVLMPVLALGAPPPEKDWRTEADELFDFGS